MSPLVKIQNLSYTYHTPKGETKTLENINLMINKGEFISIVGPSGCGKSTLLSVISGLIQPSIGEVFLDKSLINNDSHYIGYMLQKDHLFEWRTVYRNVLLGLEINNKLNAENLEYIDSLLKQYGLHEFKNYKPSQLSGGMRQRAALIRTLALKPEILLLDEPFAALDYQTRLSAGDEIGTIIKKENKTALLVTHDIAEAIFNKKLLYILNYIIYTSNKKVQYIFLDCIS
ncbi:ABC transporter ATP-binding protein [Vallitalea guaymasensis]|uniref:ABC transporter ATP-binding protein n=1 Tax=Vallitalea guaymasensis TaxID=1185412 RepID=A0A8J8SAZ0_9FIRM|nr:ABC transporter ATP-binding protein [Vallitalea guaymasensis]QUH28177.1 ABC transporter ATP-binding protein [Vallitalea guaymasensis]